MILDSLAGLERALHLPPDGREKVPVPWSILTGQTTTVWSVGTVPLGWEWRLNSIGFRLITNLTVRGAELRADGRAVWDSGLITNEGMNSNIADPIDAHFAPGQVITVAFTTSSGGASPSDLFGEGHVEFIAHRV